MLTSTEVIEKNEKTLLRRSVLRNMRKTLKCLICDAKYKYGGDYDYCSFCSESDDDIYCPDHLVECKDCRKNMCCMCDTQCEKCFEKYCRNCLVTIDDAYYCEDCCTGEQSLENESISDEFVLEEGSDE